jgi:hypothetical protein
MTSYTDTQINVWLRGLLAIAWADGDFSIAERAAILDLTQTELAVLYLIYPQTAVITSDQTGLPEKSKILASDVSKIHGISIVLKVLSISWDIRHLFG